MCKFFVNNSTLLTFISFNISISLINSRYNLKISLYFARLFHSFMKSLQHMSLERCQRYYVALPSTSRHLVSRKLLKCHLETILIRRTILVCSCIRLCICQERQVVPLWEVVAVHHLFYHQLTDRPHLMRIHLCVEMQSNEYTNRFEKGPKTHQSPNLVDLNCHRRHLCQMWDYSHICSRRVCHSVPIVKENVSRCQKISKSNLT